MPRIKTHNISIEIAKKASTEIIEQVSNLVKCDPAHVTIQVCQDKFVAYGKEIQSHPFVELALITRPKEVEHQLVQIISDAFLKAGCQSVDLYIVHLSADCYFEK